MEGADIFKKAYENSNNNSFLDLLTCKKNDKKDKIKNEIIMIDNK